MKKSKFIIVALIAFLSITSSHARNKSTPENTVTNFFVAYQHLDWEKAANYLHPEVINEIRVQIVNIIKKVKDSDVHDILSEFGVDTLAELEQMAPNKFYIKNQNRWIQNNIQDVELWSKAKSEITNSVLVHEEEYIIGLRCTISVDGKVIERRSNYIVKRIGNEWKIIKINKIE
jgi:hypothetical protein